MVDWGWFYFFTKPLFWLLELIKGFVGNFGVAILIVTVLVKLAFFPLQNKSYESMSKMKKLQPEMEKIKQRNPDDRMKQQQEMMELYKREKVSPLAGCLPIVIQIPVFFALYKVIYVTIELRHAPFLWGFTWIKDLSQPDHLITLSQPVTLFGLLPISGLNILPILMGVTFFFQQKYFTPKPATMTPEQEQQQKMMQWMSVLRSLAAYQMYRRHVRQRVTGEHALRFLLQNNDFPRSVHFCLTRAQHILPTMPPRPNVERALMRINGLVRNADPSYLARHNPAEFMDEIQTHLGYLHSAIAEAYFSS
jgi:YidC/Oxa1 family membrane protein insertase